MTIKLIKVKCLISLDQIPIQFFTAFSRKIKIGAWTTRFKFFVSISKVDEFKYLHTYATREDFGGYDSGIALAIREKLEICTSKNLLGNLIYRLDYVVIPAQAFRPQLFRAQIQINYQNT